MLFKKTRLLTSLLVLSMGGGSAVASNPNYVWKCSSSKCTGSDGYWIYTQIESGHTNGYVICCANSGSSTCYQPSNVTLEGDTGTKSVLSMPQAAACTALDSSLDSAGELFSVSASNAYSGNWAFKILSVTCAQASDGSIINSTNTEVIMGDNNSNDSVQGIGLSTNVDSLDYNGSNTTVSNVNGDYPYHCTNRSN